MKVLKIEDKKCYYSVDGDKYSTILDIDKEDIYTMLDILYTSDDTSFDEVVNDTDILNDVEKIIYKSIFDQFKQFLSNKETLKSEIDDEFKDSYEKYKLGNFKVE